MINLNDWYVPDGIDTNSGIDTHNWIQSHISKKLGKPYEAIKKTPNSIFGEYTSTDVLIQDINRGVIIDPVRTIYSEPKSESLVDKIKPYQMWYNNVVGKMQNLL